MNKSSTYTVKPNEDLKRVNVRLAQFHSSEYEKGTLEVHKQRGVHHITLRIKESDLSYNSIPGPRQSWDDQYFPDIVRFVFDRPLRTTDFPTDNFSLNTMPIPSSSVIVEDQYSFTVSLTGNRTGQITGNNSIIVDSNIYGRNGSELVGTLWNGEMSDDILPRSGRDPFYSKLGGQLKIVRLTLHKSSTPEKELDRFSRRRKVSVLDYSFIDTSPSSGITGWLYVLFDDTDAFQVEYIDPSRDAVIQNIDATISIKLSNAIDPQYTNLITGTGAPTARIYTTNYEDTTLQPAALVQISTTNDLITITPHASTQTEGLHQLLADFSDIYSVDGQSFNSPGQRIWSSYYLKRVPFPKVLADLDDVDLTTPPTDGQVITYDNASSTWIPGDPATGSGGGSTGTGGAPTDSPYVTWQADTDLSNDRIIERGVYVNVTNDGTNLTIDLDTAATDSIYTPLSEYSGHTGDTSLHYQVGDISHTNITDIGTTTHAQIDAHVTSMTGHTGDTSLHYLVGDISHTNITDIGTNTHPQLDLHVDSMTGHTGDLVNPHFVTASQVGSPTIADYTGHTGDLSTHFTVGSILHTAIDEVGNYEHAEIDTHIDNTNNPHAVTAADVGSPTLASYTGHTGDISNPHSVIASQVNILDSAGLFSSAHVENALAELAGSYSHTYSFRRSGSMNSDQVIRGMVDSTDNSARIMIPAGTNVKCLHASMYGHCGSTSTDYAFDAGIAVYSFLGFSNTVESYYTGVTATGTADAKAHNGVGGTLSAPLFEFNVSDSGPKSFQLFYRNRSTATSTSDNYIASVTLVFS